LRIDDVSTDAKRYWGNRPDVRKYFDILEKLAHERHKSIYPNYKYKKTIKNNNLTPKKGFAFKYVQQDQQRNKSKDIKNNKISSPSSTSSPSISMSYPNININDIDLHNYNDSIQEQASNGDSNSVTLDGSSYSYLFNNNNDKFDNNLFCDNEFLVFQLPPVEGFESIDIINDSNNYNNFDTPELINNVNKDMNDIINIYLSQLDNENNLNIEKNLDFNTINNIHEENGYDQVNNF